jgi:hypothetical protein
MERLPASKPILQEELLHAALCLRLGLITSETAGSWAHLAEVIMAGHLVCRALGAPTAEESYRRGYVDGFEAAIGPVLAAALSKSKRTELRRICNFIDCDLRNWSWDAGREDYEVEVPPEFALKIERCP